jgi:hypothetical protein
MTRVAGVAVAEGAMEEVKREGKVVLQRSTAACILPLQMYE